MMTDRELSARDHPSAPHSIQPAAAGSISGHSKIEDVLRSYESTPCRTALARLLGSSPLTAQGRADYRLAMGEVEVGDALDTLAVDGAWQVLHSVPVGEESEVDHLVIGSAGVYVVTTATHPDGVVEATERTFTVSHEPYPHIRNMEHEMGRVERLLVAAAGQPVQVSGVLAVVEPRSLVVHEAHRDVAVVAASSIVRWFSDRPAMLPAATVDALVAVARSQSTWRCVSEPGVDAAGLRARFDRLRIEVDRAWSCRRLWATALTVAAAGAFILVSYAILDTSLGS